MCSGNACHVKFNLVFSQIPVLTCLSLYSLSLFKDDISQEFLQYLWNSGILGLVVQNSSALWCLRRLDSDKYISIHWTRHTKVNVSLPPLHTVVKGNQQPHSLVHLIILRHRQTLMEVHGVYNVAGHIKQQHTRKHLQRRAAETSFCFQVLLH